MSMSRFQRCVPSSLYSLNAFPQQSKETTISHLAIMPHEPEYLDVLRRLFLSEDELPFDLARIAVSFPYMLQQQFSGKVQMVLYGTKQTEISQMLVSWHSFPISYQGTTYGVLLVAPDAARSGKPLLPFALISILTLHCGAMLALFEHQILVQGTASPPAHERRSYEPLTRRQREVLTLMSQGYDEQAIARRLHISTTTVESHRQNMYVRLGVHTKHDALRVGYQQHLFTPLDAVTGEPPSPKTRTPSSRKKRRPPQ